MFYEGGFLRAFPMVVDEVPARPVSPDETVRSYYTWRTLVPFAGLATVEPSSDEFLCREYWVKVLPLLGEAVRSQLSA
ncbi:MAG: hypothetical protein WA970_14550 [Gammaproteobacteria bacterium]